MKLIYRNHLIYHIKCLVKYFKARGLKIKICCGMCNDNLKYLVKFVPIAQFQINTVSHK